MKITVTKITNGDEIYYKADGVEHDGTYQFELSFESAEEAEKKLLDKLNEKREILKSYEL